MNQNQEPTDEEVVKTIIATLDELGLILRSLASQVSEVMRRIKSMEDDEQD